MSSDATRYERINDFILNKYLSDEAAHIAERVGELMNPIYWISWIYKSEGTLGFSIGTGAVECPVISTQDDVKNIASKIAKENPDWFDVAILGFGRLEGHDY